MNFWEGSNELTTYILPAISVNFPCYRVSIGNRLLAQSISIFWIYLLFNCYFWCFFACSSFSCFSFLMVSSSSRADAKPIGNENFALFFGLVKTSCIGLIGPTVCFEILPTELSVLYRFATDEMLRLAGPAWEAELILVLIYNCC